MNITNNIVTAYIDTLYRCDNENLKRLREFAEEKRIPVILKDSESLIVNLLRIKKPERLLEIGAAIGYSSCCFADSCGCMVTTVESDEEYYKAAKNNIESLGFSGQVDILLGDAREVLKNIEIPEGGIFDAVFIDAAKSHYREFWDLAVPLCRDDAVIICDNVLMKAMTASDDYDPKKRYKTSIRKMRDFVNYITRLDYADTCVLPVGDGISVSVIGSGGTSDER
ncbi:MAG TPA: O-methyltransferase [Candidatus Copromorpha excrementigallinarum]|uniref:tRNA 5-hydroxyuridine methyltransferase n=1 Tax=Candidatus Allocopromorpha excrementigallinarum TaxID=2840742 RepID=A0A9D1I1W2_9FIRM|nr:O-methyltransferase [Candidatus Copromorpha excrementigallinarum]